MRYFTCRIPLSLFVLAAMMAPSVCAQQVPVSWIGGPGSSNLPNWQVPAHWNPAVVPNNNGTATYSVSITSANALVLMDSLNTTIDNLTLGTADELTVDESNLQLASGASLNNGQLTTLEGAVLVASPAGFTNDGTISLGPFGELTNAGHFINNGLISEFSDSGIGNQGTFANSGSISLDASGLDNSGTFNSTGTIKITSVFDPGSFENSSTFNNNGSMNVTFNAWSESSFANSGILNNTGTTNLVAGCVETVGSLPICTASASNTGTINNAGTLNITAVTGSAPLLNSGTLNNTGTLSNLATSTICNTGIITNSGQFTDAGALIVSNTGLFTTSTGYTQTGGSTTVDGIFLASGGQLNIQGGTLGGTGSIAGNVVVGGTMMPGDAPGTLTILGDYEQTGAGIFDELMSAESQSVLDVTGGVTLDPGAELQITLLNGFDPLGQRFDIMDFSNLNGEFANGSRFWDDNYLWDITYGQNQIDVTAVQAPEPGGLLLLAAGLVTLLLAPRKWRRRSLAFPCREWPSRYLS